MNPRYGISEVEEKYGVVHDSRNHCRSLIVTGGVCMSMVIYVFVTLISICSLVTYFLSYRSSTSFLQALSANACFKVLSTFLFFSPATVKPQFRFQNLSHSPNRYGRRNNI